MPPPDIPNNNVQDRADRSSDKLFQSARLLLGQMTSHNISETANQVTALANQAGPESKESLWDSIVGLVFRGATRDIINVSETTRLCAQLCRHLVQTSGNQGRSLLSREDWLIQQIFWLCISTLPPRGRTQTPAQQPVSTVFGGAQHTQGNAGSHSASSECPPAERITFFVTDLYSEKVITAPQVHLYIGRLINSGASTDQCATGLCPLMEQHGQTLDDGHYKNDMDSSFRWIDIAATEYLADTHLATRLKAIIRLRSGSWEAGRAEPELVEHESSIQTNHFMPNNASSPTSVELNDTLARFNSPPGAATGVGVASIEGLRLKKPSVAIRVEIAGEKNAKGDREEEERRERREEKERKKRDQKERKERQAEAEAKVKAEAEAAAAEAKGKSTSAPNNTLPIHSRRQSTLGSNAREGPVESLTPSRDIAGTGHRSSKLASSISTYVQFVFSVYSQ
ncbi:hypothetical protein BDV93DRAFT_241193 [Ceratobasidium sp. AG-I]|nr:hypothetical protein BDV93DRAFT_241193 [Ceratobasidium sp. AG-I]